MTYISLSAAASGRDELVAFGEAACSKAQLLPEVHVRHETAVRWRACSGLVWKPYHVLVLWIGGAAAVLRVPGASESINMARDIIW